MNKKICLAFAAALFVSGCSLQAVAPLKEKKSVRFCAAGDVMLDRGVKGHMERKGHDYPYSSVTDFIKSHDVAFCNLEGPVTDYKKRNKPFAFRCEPGRFDEFMNTGFNIVSLANNHMFDCGPAGVTATITELEGRGLAFAGAGHDRDNSFEAAVMDVNGVKIAVVAFADFFHYIAENKNRLTQPQACYPQVEDVAPAIKAARKLAPFVIVSWHWGEEYKHYPNKRQKMLGRLCVDAGADLVIGHHPHVLQGAEYYKGKLILYSLGNFVFDQYHENRTESAVFSCTIEDNKIKDPFLTPVKIRKSKPSFARKEDAKKISKALLSYSEGMDIDVERKGTRIFLSGKKQ